MTPDRDDMPLATPSAPASAGELTRTSDPSPTSVPDAATASDSRPGQTRDPRRYGIIAEHGRGGLGRVSRAHDNELGRDIAIKELLSRDHVNEVRFMREALITARLEHPNIVPVYEAGRWPDGTPFYAMKLVAGRSLRELITERTTVEARIGLLHHVIAVADAIAYAHRINIIHRDLKPANVIVGDFGETIVIDWGLAKDLSAGEASTIATTPFRVSHDDGLTVAGSVLGTPAYMAPEQERGEQVDQRADVFAIGAMLWEVCSLRRTPPSEQRLRHRMLRRAGIDKDLITIIDKALHDDPAQRYSDAGELAADLKAFRSGARIAARSYSLFAILGHWIRRHRTFTLSATIAVVLAAAGVITYFRHITAERDRVHVANSTLILEQAELLLQRDPTAAFELLQTYAGADSSRLAMLRAEARGLGISHLRVRPHTQGIIFAQPLADGSLVTLGGDGTAVKTSPLGASRVIATKVNPQYTFAYASASHLLAYACSGTAICLLDLVTERERTPPPDTSTFEAIRLAFSPSGALLAAKSARGEVSLWQLLDDGSFVRRLHVQLGAGEVVAFVDEHTLAAHADGHVHIFHLDGQGQASSAPSELAVSDGEYMVSNGDLHLVAVSAASGEVTIIDSQQGLVTQHATLCKGSLVGLYISSVRFMIEYACQDGDVGAWDLQQRSRLVLAHLEGGAVEIDGSADGRHLVAGANNGTLLIHDFMTGMSHTYVGHSARISRVVPPSATYPYLISGDAAGVMRTWSPPDPAIQVVAHRTARVYKAMILSNHGPVIAIENSSKIPWFAPAGTSGELHDHNDTLHSAARSPTQSSFVMYGNGNELEIWSFGSSPTKKTLSTKHGVTGNVAYMADGTRFLVGARDGSITEWSSQSDTSREFGSIPEPIAFIHARKDVDAAVVGGKDGTLWLLDERSVRYIGKESSLIVSTAMSQDSRWLAIGTRQGAVAIYDMHTQYRTLLPYSGTWVEFMTFSPDGRELAVATEKMVVRIPSGEWTGAPMSAARRSFELAARYIVYSGDSKWLALTSDQGGIWFNRRTDDSWLYLPGNRTNIRPGNFSADSDLFAAVDMRNQVLTIDMRANIFNAQSHDN